MKMFDPNSRGFAGPVDYEKFGHYLPTPPDGSTTLSGYTFGFHDRVTSDGSSPYAPESGRYHVYLSIGCPWAQRVAIAIELQGLGKAISYSTVDDARDARGWAFRARRGGDPVNDFSFLAQAYLQTDANFSGHINVPTLWDRKTGRIVNNADDEIFEDVVRQFRGLGTSGLDLYPQELAEDIDELGAEIHGSINFGVYEAGLATNQADHDAAVERAFGTLDQLEERLARSRYLFGDTVTEVDIRLWVSLARFDIVYNPLFRVNLKRLTDYPRLWGYARDLYGSQAFAARTEFDAIKVNYFAGIPQLNPSGIVPRGPVVDWGEPQDRAWLSGPDGRSPGSLA